MNELPDATESGPPSSLLNRPFTSNLTQVCSVIHASFWNARSSPGLPQRREQTQKGQGSKSTRGDTPLSSERGTMSLHFAYFTITWEDIRFHCCDGGSRPSIESTSTRDASMWMRDDMLLLRPVGCGTGGQLCNELHRVASRLEVCKTIRENEYMAVTWHTGWELFLFDQFR